MVVILRKHRYYRNREGGVVRILRFERCIGYLIHIGSDDRRYYTDGRFSHHEESPYDLVEDVTFVEHKGIFVDNIPVDIYNVPKGPLYLVWSPDGESPPRFLFTKLRKAERAATRMAERHCDKGQVFFVAHLLSWHQQQLGPVKGEMKINITGFGQ